MSAIAELAEKFATEFPGEAAQVLEGLAHDQIAELLAELAPGAAADLLAEISVSTAARALQLVRSDRRIDIVESLPLPIAANLLRRFPPELRKSLLSETESQIAGRIRSLLRYPPHTVGSAMSPHVRSFSEETIVGTAIEKIRGEGEPGDFIYVTEEGHALTGVVSVGELVAADPDTNLSSVMSRHVVRLRHDDPLDMVAKHDAWWKWRALPVVEQGVLIGVLEYKAVRSLSGVERAETDLAVSLPVSLAELMWLGLIGMTDGLTRVVTRSGDTDAR